MSFCFPGYHPTAASSVFLSSHVAGPGGIFESIFWNYKESTQRKEEHAAMQDSARQDKLFSSLGSSVLFRLSCGYYALVTICHDYTYMLLSVDRWLDVSSFWG